MTRYVALLRAVTVGGHTVRMDRLRALFGELGLAGVGSYIQTGNVFFDSDEPDRAALTARIEAHLKQALGYPVPTLLRTVDDLEAVLALDPFAGREITPDIRLTILFTAEPPPAAVPPRLGPPRGDVEMVHAARGEVFVIWPLRGARPPTPDHSLATMVPGPTPPRFPHPTAKITAAARK